MKFNKKSVFLLKLLAIASVGNFMISEGKAGRFDVSGNSHGLNHHRHLEVQESKRKAAMWAAAAAKKHAVANRPDENQSINLLNQEFRGLLENLPEVLNYSPSMTIDLVDLGEMKVTKAPQVDSTNTRNALFCNSEPFSDLVEHHFKLNR